jgi:hypothetical protein
MDKPPSAAPSAPEPDDKNTREALEHIRKALRGLRFGQVTVTVQDGVVVQLERVERQRLDRGSKRR